jgi:hypothetical protein
VDENEIKKKKAAECMAHTRNPSYPRGRGRRIVGSRADQEKSARPYLKNKEKKKKEDPGHSSSGRELAWLA